ncbi:MAG: heparinase II/III domain-containing protein [Sporichthyaceae bacterium]
MRRTIATTVALMTAAGLASAMPAGADDRIEDAEPPAPGSIAAATTPGASEPQCMGDRYIAKPTDAADAAALMDGRLTLTHFGSWNLPSNPTWREDPFANDVWEFDYQTLRWADVLRREGLRTNNQAMLDRYSAILSDWVADNRFDAPRRSPLSWHGMVVGVRSIGLTCALDALGASEWLEGTIDEHADSLLNPDQRARANHALHQDMGLLALGCSTGTTFWRNTAVARASEQLPKLIDSEGVAREGALQYQMLDHRWYITLQARMLACGLVPDPAVFARLALMPDFIGYATQPDGYAIAWGDTSLFKSPSVAGSVAEYVVSKGLKGLLPKDTFALFKESGYAFSRSDWFDTEAADEQSLASVRFGPAMNTMPHAHEDAGAVSFYAAGKQILWQPGLYAYGAGTKRTYVRSNEAHNVIDIAGATYDRDKGASLASYKSTSSYDLVGVRTSALKGADWKRTVVHFKGPNLLLVDDQIDQSKARTVYQNWQLGSDRSVKTGDMHATTSGSGSDATILWVGTNPSVKVRKGESSPWLGWRSPKTNQFEKAPIVQAGKTGTSVRLTAIVVPRTGSETVKVLRSATHATSRTIDVQVGSKKYRIVVTRTDASIKPL